MKIITYDHVREQSLEISGPFISFSFSYVMLTFFSVFKTEGFEFVVPSVFESKENLQF
jgi:hypothetical protein